MDHVVYTDEDFKLVDSCPMCGSTIFENWYEISAGGAEDKQGNMKHRRVKVARCECGLAYARKVFSDSGKDKYWSTYSSQVHESSPQDVANREQMYEMEFDYIQGVIGSVEGKRIIDIGCGEARFLDVFARHGAICEGVEIGNDCIRAASERYKVYQGEFPDIDVDGKYDLVIFRGTVQYFEKPAEYLEKAISVLNDGGHIFITSSPNADAYTHKLFKNHFVLPINAIAKNGFSPAVLKDWFATKGYRMCGETYFYEGTPYCNIEKNLATVAKALEYQKWDKEIDFRAPAFWGNMFTVVFTKE